METNVTINTLDQAKAYISALHRAGWLYHLEDDPATIVWASASAPTLAQIGDMRIRAEEIYNLDWSKYGCPIGYIIECGM